MPAVAGKQPLLRLAPETSPVGAQLFEQLGAEHDIAVLAALAFADMNHHPLAIKSPIHSATILDDPLLERCEREAAVCNEGHDDAEDGTHDDWRLLGGLDVNPDEEQAFDAEYDRGGDGKVRVGMKKARKD